jgi:error-prone DNA polymerase
VYIELHAASAFSFLQGASLPETLVERAAALGYPALALLDADGVYGAPRFHKAARKAGLRPIVGAELTIGGVRWHGGDSHGGEPDATVSARDGGRGTPRGSGASWTSGAGRDSGVPASRSGKRGSGGRAGGAPSPGEALHRWRLPVLVASPEGYRNLCRLVTRMKMRAAKGDCALALDELDGCTAGLVALAGRPLLDGRRHGVGGLLDRLVGLFGRANVCVDLQRHLLRDEESDNVALTALAQAFRVPVVATNGVRFATPADRPLFDVLTCVRHRTTLEAAGRQLARNAERYLKSPEAMAKLFADRPTRCAAPRRWPSASNTRWPTSATASRRIRCRMAKPRCRS